jgi:4-hydroxy-tetrahydrodipicolinate reductase
MTIRVLISGSGNMGHEVLAAICRQEGFTPAGVVDLYADADSIPLPEGSASVPFSADVAEMIKETRPDVAVDFTNAEWTPRLAEAALEAGVRLVIGTSGLGDEFAQHLKVECESAGSAP